MSSLSVHMMDEAWTSSNKSLLKVSVDAGEFVEGAGSNRLEAEAGAAGAAASFAPMSAIDLNEFDEICFWVRSNRAADGEASAPFFLEFSFSDENDAAGEEHRWFIPVNRAGCWEQRRIGIQADRRGAVRSFRFKCLDDLPFVCNLDELLAVRGDLIPDVERALAAQLDGRLTLPGLTGVPLSKPAKADDVQIAIVYAPGFTAGNRIVVRGGNAGDETHDVRTVTHDRVNNTTTLGFAADDKVRGPLVMGTATVSVSVPLCFATPPTPPAAPAPAFVATLIDLREDPERTAYITQRDSFRPREGATIYSTRPGARAYLLDYQLTPVATDHMQLALAYGLIARRLSPDTALRVNGSPSPVWLLPAPPIEDRPKDTPAPVYVRIGARMETAARQEAKLVRRYELVTAPLSNGGARQ